MKAPPLSGEDLAPIQALGFGGYAWDLAAGLLAYLRSTHFASA